MHCGRTWPDDKQGRNNLSKHKHRRTNSDGTMNCMSKYQKNKNKADAKRKLMDAKQELAKLDPQEIISLIQTDKKNNEKNDELNVRLKLKNEEIESLTSKNFQACKFPDPTIARRCMTEPERRLILEKQGNMCAGANCKLTMSGRAYDIDHKISIQFGGDNQESNLQALCADCHRKKTDFERTLKTVLENGGSQTVVFPDKWPHIIPNGIYSHYITTPIVIYKS